MAQINKRVVFLKNEKGAVAGTVALSGISDKVYIKASLMPQGKYIIALEGDTLPLTLLNSEEIKKDFYTGLNCGIGNEISVIVFSFEGTAYTLKAYGCFGKNNIPQDVLLIRAKKRMIGGKIVPPQTDIQAEKIKSGGVTAENIALKEKEIADKYEKAYEIIKTDPYILEDKTLKDIDILAEENYYEKYTKEFLSQKVDKAQGSESEKQQAEDFEILKSVENGGEWKSPQEGTYFNSENNGYLYKESEENAYYTDKDIKIEIEKGRQPENTDYGTGSYYDEQNDFYTGNEDCKINTGGGNIKDYLGYDMRESGENIMENGMSYYDSVKDKIEKLLSENERDETLCGIIPESDIVKVYYGEGKYYSAGVIKEGGMPLYICYAVNGVYSDNPPPELAGISRWVPADSQNPSGEGWYIMFQSAADGKYIK